MKTFQNSIGKNEVWRKLTRVQGLSALLPLAVIVVFLSLTTDTFLTADNLMNVMRQAAVYAVMATGMTFVLLTGGVDLSQGSLLAMCCVTSCMALNATGSMWIAILTAMGTGLIVGAVNGTVISMIKLPPFIMTLGALYMVRGITLYITNSTQVRVSDNPAFTFIGKGDLFGIPVPVYVFIAVGILASLFLTYTSTGRNIFAVGSNESSARLSGVNVTKTLIIAYALSGLCVGIGAVVYLARLSAAQPTAGESYEMEAIAAAVVGGTSQSGGEGGILGSLIGAVIIASIRNGLVLLGVGSYFTKIVVGLIIVLAVAIDVTRRRLAANR